MPRRREAPSFPIDHSKIMDGFGELRGFTHYVPFESFCGLCGVAFVLSPAAQKHMLEDSGLPVKALRSAAYCDECTARRRRRNQLRRGQAFLEIENGREELAAIEAHEATLLAATMRAQSHGQFQPGKWPYVRASRR